MNTIRQAPVSVIRNLEQAPAAARPRHLAADMLAGQQPDGSWPEHGEDFHEAMAAMLRDDTFQRDPRTTAALQHSLAQSWKHFTGQVPEGNDLLAPLPSRRALAQSILDAQQPDGSWNHDVDASVLNHVALAGLLRRRSMQGDPALVERLDGALRQSWKNLTGQIPVGEKALGPLPSRRTLSRTSAASAAFHEVILGRSVEVRLHPDQVLARAEAYEAGAPAQQPSRAGRWLAAAGVVAAGVTAALLPESFAVVGQAVADLLTVGAVPALQFVAGVATGWAESSYAESLIHDRVHHAEKAARESWKDMGQVGEYLQEGYIGHQGYHHGATYKENHITQFESEDEKNRIIERLRKTGRPGVIDDEFGVTMSWKSCGHFILAASPAYVPTLAAANAAGLGMAFNIGFAIPVALYPLHSKFLHRYTHMSGQDMMQKAPLPIRAYLQSKLGRFITSHHMVHHDTDTRSTGPVSHYDDHEVVNTNLTPPLGDLLRGTLRRPTVEQEEKMRRMGMLYY